MAIELPELLQRVIIDTKSMEKAEKKAKALQDQLDSLGGTVEDTTGTFDENTDVVAENTTGTEDNTTAVGDNSAARSENADIVRNQSQNTADNTDAVGANTSAVGSNTRVTDDNTRAQRDNVRTSREAAGGRKKDDRSWHDHIGSVTDANQALSLFGKVAGGLKIPVMAGALPYAAQGFAALGVGAMAFVQQVGPVVGVLGAVPGAMLAIKSTSFVWGAVTEGPMNAAKAIQEYGIASEQALAAMKELGPEGQKFAVSLAGIGTEMDALKTDMQGAALPGFNEVLKVASASYLPAFKDGMMGIAGVLGDLGKETAAWMGQTSRMADFKTIMTSNTAVVKNLSGAFTPLLSIITDVMVTAGPMLEQMAKDLANVAQAASEWVAEMRSSGKMADFFQRAYDILKVLVGAVWDVVMAFKNMSGAIKGAFGIDFVSNIADGAQAFRDWTASAEGQAKIAAIAKEATEVFHELWLVIVDIGTAFGGWSTAEDVDLSGLIKTFREDMLPTILSFIDGAKALVPAIMPLASGLMDFANALPFSPLAKVIEIMGTLLGAIASVVTAVPGLGSLVAVLLTVKTASAGMGIANSFLGGVPGKLFNIVKASGPVQGALSKIGTVLNNTLLKGIGKALPLFSKLGSVLTNTLLRGIGKLLPILSRLSTVIRVVAVSVRVLGMAFLTSPIGWIILGIMALVAVFIIMWKKFDWFRAFWIGLWEKVKAVAKAVWDWLVSAWQAVWGAIEPVVKAIWAGIVFYFKLIWTVISTYVKVWWTIISTAFKIIWKIISTVVMAVWTVVSTYFKMLWAFWSTIFKALWDVVSAVFGFVWNLIVTVVTAIWTVVSTYLKMVWAFWSVIFKAIWDLAVTVWTAIWNVIKTVLGFIWDVISAVFTAVWNFITAVWTAIWNVISTILTAIWNVISSVFTTIWNIVTTIWNAIAGVISSVWNTIKNAVSSAINWVKTTIESVLNTIKGIWDGIWNGISSAFSGIWETIKTVARNAVNWVKDKIQGLIDKITSIPVLGDALGAALSVIGHATGGAVRKDQPALVGERGPEIFVPWQSGQIIPNHRLTEAAPGRPAPGVAAGGGPQAAAAGGTVVNYNITVNNPTGEPSETSLLRSMQKVALAGAATVTAGAA